MFMYRQIFNWNAKSYCVYVPARHKELFKEIKIDFRANRHIKDTFHFDNSIDSIHRTTVSLGYLILLENQLKGERHTQRKKNEEYENILTVDRLHAIRLDPINILEAEGRNPTHQNPLSFNCSFDV